jgi:hypothetical protein
MLTAFTLTLPSSTISDLTAYVGGLFGDLSPLWILAIALPLGFWVISKVIGIITSHTRARSR